MKLAKKLISLTLSIVMVAVLGVAVLAAGRAYHRNGKDNYTKNRSPCQQENQIFSIFFLEALDQPLQLRAGEVVHPVAELARQVAGALLGQNGGEFVPTQ